MQILGLLGMYFDAVVVEVEKSLLFFRFALAILCLSVWNRIDIEIKIYLVENFPKLYGDKLSPSVPIWSVGAAVKYRRAPLAAAKLCIGERYDARANGSASLPVDKV